MVEIKGYYENQWHTLHVALKFTLKRVFDSYQMIAIMYSNRFW